ncbi:MAG TPA: hypothetical protein VGA40_08240 [Candidatus Acidoferrales bacterium]
MPAVFAQEAPVASLTADQVVQKMVERNEQRAQALQSYRGTRVYQLEHHGIANKNAQLVVTMTYRQPGEKKFCIVSESGSQFLHNRVLRRLIEAEVEAMQADHRRRTAMDPDNYEFQWVGLERIFDRGFYVLEVVPRVKNKFLFRGRIWVDEQDFAIVRMEGEPAKNPSWWTKRNLIQVTYEKIGEFWLPTRNETNTQVRIFGKSQLTILYQNYEILNGSAAQLTPASGSTMRCLEEPAKTVAARP